MRHFFWTNKDIYKIKVVGAAHRNICSVIFVDIILFFHEKC